MKEFYGKQADNVVLFPGSVDRPFQMTEAAVLRRLDEREGYAERLRDSLMNGTSAEQLAAVGQLTYIYEPETIQALRTYIEREEGDPVAKTLALRALKEQGEMGMICVRKFGRQLMVEIGGTPASDHELPTGQAMVMNELREVAEMHDASVLPLAFQLWTTHFFMAYPFVPDVEKEDAKVWAAALHYAVTQLLGVEQGVQRISDIYSVSAQDMTRCYKEIQMVPGLIL